MRADDDETIEDHDRGLAYDLPRLISRRRAVGLLAGGIGTAGLAACGSSGDDVASSAPAADTTEIPEETAGPFPGTGPTARTSSLRAAWSAATSRAASVTRRASPRAFPPRSR